MAFHDYEGNDGLVSKHFEKELSIISGARLLSAYFYINRLLFQVEKGIHILNKSGLIFKMEGLD